MMNQKPRQDPVATRRRILESAGKLFAEKGFDGVGLREIAAKAKVSLRQPNHHFGAKAELFAACVRFALEEKVRFPALFSDEPVFASTEDARRQLGEKIRAVFTAIHPLTGRGSWYGEILALAMHIHTPQSVEAIGEGFARANMWFIAAVRTIRPDVTEQYCLLWRASLWAQISFYSTARRNMLFELGTKDYTGEFLVAAANHVAEVMLSALKGRDDDDEEHSRPAV